MSLDLLDAAFVRRLADRDRAAAVPRVERQRPAPRPPRAESAVVAAPIEPVFVNAPIEPVASAAPAEPAVVVAAPRPVADPIVARLLALVPDQWDALARHCESARQRGRRVIAVAGGRAGEGRTTLVRCLAEILRARGRDVACADAADLAAVAAGPDGRGPTHDKRIVLVDAGVWFPPGPIRRSLLQVASLGCEAAILVRRAGASGGFSRQAALEALGIEVLGEVLTFTSPDGATTILAGGAAA
jgi:hypothetical protein